MQSFETDNIVNLNSYRHREPSLRDRFVLKLGQLGTDRLTRRSHDTSDYEEYGERRLHVLKQTTKVAGRVLAAAGVAVLATAVGNRMWDNFNGAECQGETTYTVGRGEGLDDAALSVPGEFDRRDVRGIIIEMNPDLNLKFEMQLQAGQSIKVPTSCEQ